VSINSSPLARKLGFGAEDLPRWLGPAVTKRLSEYRQLRRELTSLKRIAENCRSITEVLDAMRDFPNFRTDQKAGEIIPALEMLAQQPPQVLCEIGSGLGGTLFLLTRVCAPNALIVTIDIGHSLVRSQINPLMARDRQTIVSIRGDSADPKTLSRFKQRVKGKQLDCLFIDGDHSFNGVMADFTNYSGSVRPGGKIFFHDIVTDFKTRFNVDTGAWTGGVPQFWSTLRADFDCQELIEDPEQDGYGLGLVHWTGSR
jgi:cephalosporin hydroxylase